MTLNKQGANGIEWTHVFGAGTGYTWNPVGGCFHACEWTMPDGSVAQCYAKDVAEHLRSDKFFPQGFESHYFHANRLTEPLAMKTPAGIFVDSMSDLMGHWVPEDEIEQVLDVCRKTPQHVYFLLTKNAPRLLKFDFPPNVWVGVSAPPSSFMGRSLTEDQQTRMLIKSLDVLRDLDVPVKWMSIEPLSFDIAPFILRSGLNWAVIGAASRGRATFQPDPEWVRRLLNVFRGERVPVFFKGNLAWHVRREEFPTISATQPQQMGMF